MIRDLFYFADLQRSMDGIEIDLPNDEAKHLFVRRYNVGDTIQLFNGIRTSQEVEGLTAIANITELSKHKAKVDISNVNVTAPPKITITIASALPKNDRLHTMLDMATQSGMTDFIPLSCQRSVTKIKSNEKNTERLQKFLIESCKQCRRVNLPIIHPSASIHDLLKHKNDKSIVCFADEMGDYLSPSLIHPLLSEGIENIMVFVGPEGGFTPNEITTLTEKAIKIKLSNAILRTETATALAAATLTMLVDSFE